MAQNTDLVENQLTQKTDFEYVRALDAAGNPIRISKADMVKVVEELIGNRTISKDGLMSKYDFMGRKIFNDGDTCNCNELTDNGTYTIKNLKGCTGFPVSSGYGFLIVFVVFPFHAQVFISATGTWSRMEYNGFRSWIKLS